jgi:2'-deoxynucleoside 5'-phosphate N-hydrolase
MNILFTGSIRGGRKHQPAYVKIMSILKKYGTVFSEHIGDETISEYGETHISKEEIHDREMNSLQKSDLVVAEVTTPSLGVGYLIANAISFKKRVICLYEGETTYLLSAMIKGNKSIEVESYKSISDIESILDLKMRYI